ncbi:MAG: hypothetical protein VW437_09545 [Betaproteobacteria bacterium]|jgi:hypothetical protein
MFKANRLFLISLTCVLVGITQAINAADAENDWGGLPKGAGQEEVFYQCGSCHSLMLVKQQGLSRDRWEDTLVWMIEEQGMSRPTDKNWALILDYLSTHFGSQ